MNIYQRKLKIKKALTMFSYILVFSILITWGYLIYLMMRNWKEFINTINPFYIGLGILFILWIVISAWKYQDSLLAEIEDIENTMVGHFSADLRKEMLETFNDRELNKILEISRQRDKEKEDEEKSELQITIKNIKKDFHL